MLRPQLHCRGPAHPRGSALAAQRQAGAAPAVGTAKLLTPGGGVLEGRLPWCDAHAEDLGIDHAYAGNFWEGNRKMGTKSSSLVLRTAARALFGPQGPSL